MKRFDSDAVYERLFKTLQTNVEWANIVGDGTIDSILKAIAEGNSEVARYIEYSLGERKWTTAQNLSSLVSQAELIGYKRRQPVSALGYVYVSHTDINGHSRLKNFGTQFFDLDMESDYDDIVQNTNATITEQSALVPWTYSTVYTVPEKTIFKSTSGVMFFSTKAVSSRCLSESWTNIQADAAKLSQFYKDGGWNGIKYLKIPVMQGKLQTVQIGRSDGTPWQVFKLSDPTCEAALNTISQKYFYVTVSYNGVDTIYNEVYLLGQVAGKKTVFQKRMTNDGTGIEIKFGNDLCGKIPPTDAVISLTYVQSLGSGGSINTINDINTMILPAAIEDPRPTVNSTTFLSCTNATRIFGGKDADSNDSIKVKAPASYLNSMAISNLPKYKAAIDEYSPLQFLHYNLYVNEQADISEVDLSQNILLPQILSSNNLILTGVLMSGESPSSTEATDLLNTLIASIQNIMSLNDRIQWLDPELIPIRLSFDIEYNDLYTALADQETATKNNLLLSYDIFDQDFDEPVYYSDITAIAKSDNTNYTDAVIDFEANVDTSSTNMAIYKVETSMSSYSNLYYTDSSKISEYCYGISFSFSSSLLSLGDLEEPSVSNEYYVWLQADVSYKNIVNEDYYDRTLLLTDTNHSSTLAENTDIIVKGLNTISSDYFYLSIVTPNKLSISFFEPDGTSSILEANTASTVRVRQFIKDSSAKTDKYYNDLLNGNTELRRSVQTAAKSNTVDKQSIPVIDDRYMPMLTISKFFYDATDSTYKGQIILPSKLLSGILSDDKATNAIYVSSLINQYLDIKVYARSALKNIVPTMSNQLVYVDTIDINSSLVSYS